MNKTFVKLTDCYKHYTYDQDKVCTPLETVNRFKERLDKIDLFILKEVRRIDTGRLNIPVYFSVCGKDAENVIGNKKQMGKGCTPEQAEASACMELAERFSFFSFKNNSTNFITATYRELKSRREPLLPLSRLLQSVHDETTKPQTLETLINDIPLKWAWAVNLTSNKELLIPFSWFFAINEFNGPSAGNSYEEAVLQGISEIVERHVCGVVTHEQINAPAIDLASVTDPVARELIDKFIKNDIELYLNDFTLDTGIPTIAALAIDRNSFPEQSEIVYTAGTTPDPTKALIRALTEVAQLAGDFESKSNYVASGLPKPLRMSEVEYITKPGKLVNLDSLPDLSDNNMLVEIDNCLAALKMLEMEVLVVKTTHPDLLIPAIYTIVPGAHFRERSMGRNAALFAAKMAAELIPDPHASNHQLTMMSKLLPDSYYIEFYLGKNLLKLKEYEKALKHLQKALTLEPLAEDLPYIYSFIGDCLKDLGRYEEAVNFLGKGAALDDERPDIHNLLGFCYFKLENYQTAISHFNRSVALNPSSAIDYANLGVNYRKLNNKDAAIKNFHLALALDPTIDFARNNLEELIQ